MPPFEFERLNFVFNDSDVAELKKSRLFDESWYLNNYKDVKKLGMDPLEHYLWLGARLQRQPSKDFDPIAYIHTNPDVQRVGINPLLHYLRYGEREGRQLFPKLPSSIQPAAAGAGVRARGRVIVYESHNLKLQGAPNSLYELAVEIKKRKAFVPFMMCNTSGPLQELYEKEGIGCFIHRISQNRVMNGDNFDGYINTLAKYYRKIDASLVHVNTLQNFHSVIAAQVAGIPVIWNIRESECPDSYYDYLPEPIAERAYKAFDKVDCVIFVAKATCSLWADRLSGVTESITIHNGINTERLKVLAYGSDRTFKRASLGVRKSDVLVLSVGTLCERKGQLDLVDAIARLDPETQSRMVIAMVGFNQGDYSLRIKNRVKELHAKGVRFLCIEESNDEPARRALASLYAASDIFVLSSRIESYPRVILEAMEFSLSIVSTPCFGVVEQVEENISALFYEAGNTDLLAKHLKMLANNPSVRLKFAKAANQRLSILNSYEQMADAYEKTYERVIAAHVGCST